MAVQPAALEAAKIVPPKAADVAYRWRCPLDACNHEQGPLGEDPKSCETEFRAHLSRHSSTDFAELIFATVKWRAAFSMVEG